MVGFEVVHGLGEVNSLKFDDGFQFHQHAIFHQKVSSSAPDVLIPVKNINLLFAFGCQVGEPHFDFEGALVDDFLESVTEGPVYRHGAADDLFGYFFVHTIWC
jgi:hypothetical protein